MITRRREDAKGSIRFAIKDVWIDEVSESLRGTRPTEVDPQACIHDSRHQRLQARSRIAAALRSAIRPSSKLERSVPHSPVRNLSAIRLRSSSIETVARTTVAVREEDAAKPARNNSATVSSSPRPSCSARRWMSSTRSAGRSSVVVMGEVCGFLWTSSNDRSGRRFPIDHPPRFYPARYLGDWVVSSGLEGFEHRLLFCAGG